MLLYRRNQAGIGVSMVVGLGIIEFRIHDCRSLKEKRRIVKPIIHQIQTHFNVSVAEVGAQDVYQKAEIGFSLVGTNRRTINAKIDKLLNMVEDLGLAEVVNSDMEIINI
jgi:uncharacterized protein YlxP (DUF503 family)